MSFSAANWAVFDALMTGVRRDVSTWVSDCKINSTEDIVQGQKTTARLAGQFAGENFGKQMVWVGA